MVSPIDTTGSIIQIKTEADSFQPEEQNTEYFVPIIIREDYDKKLQLWLDNDWQLRYPEKEFSLPKGMILLMTVVQKKKQAKRCPFRDFRELKQVDAYTGNAGVCSQKLREWQQQGINVDTYKYIKKYYVQLVNDAWGALYGSSGHQTANGVAPVIVQLSQLISLCY